MEFVTGSHIFDISRYSVTSRAVTNKSYIKSDTFIVGSHNWVIKYYPNGLDEASSNCISLSVDLISNSEAEAIVDFTLLDTQNSSWSTETITNSTIQTFVPSIDNSSRGFSLFIKRSNLETSNYLKDDKLMIKCTLWVVSSKLSDSTTCKSPISYSQMLQSTASRPSPYKSAMATSAYTSKSPMATTASAFGGRPINTAAFGGRPKHRPAFGGPRMEAIGRFN